MVYPFYLCAQLKMEFLHSTYALSSTMTATIWSNCGENRKNWNFALIGCSLKRDFSRLGSETLLLSLPSDTP